MTIHEFTAQIDELFEEEINKILVPFLSEDLLTVNFLNAFVKKFNEVFIDDLYDGSRLFTTFKQKGPVETKYGDIAVIVKIKNDSSTIEGVGYLEAKLRNISTGKFKAVKKEQLVMINMNAPRARLLLYDATPVEEYIKTHALDRWVLDELKSEQPNIHAVAIPINLSLAMSKYDTGLYRFGLPLSHQLVHRYIHGHDLEFDIKSIADSNDYSERAGYSKYVLNITIARGRGNNEPRQTGKEPGYKRYTGDIRDVEIEGRQAKRTGYQAGELDYEY